MKKVVCTIFLCSCILVGIAQKFDQKHTILLPDSVSTSLVDWVDLDNDGLLDILMLAWNNSGDNFLLTYKTSLSSAPVWQSSLLTGFTTASYLLIDANDDNYIDLLLAGTLNGQPSTAALLNQEDFTFQLQPVTNKAGTVLKFSDLNRDGTKELIISGREPAGPFFSIYQHSNNSWHLVHDSLALEAESIEIIDWDRDGDQDLFVSGRRADDTIVNAVYDNSGDFYFHPRVLGSEVLGKTSLADLNHDGDFDILLAGKNAQGQNKLVVLLNHQGNVQIRDSLLTLKDQTVFAADFNSNGLCDVQFSGRNQAGDSLNLIFRDNADYDSLNTTGLVAQRFGDVDRDGDLDLVQYVVSSGDGELLIFENKTVALNLPPSKPSNPVAAYIFDRLFLYWEKPFDDHTAQASLTYDVTLQTGAGEWLVGEFDMITGKRLTVTHGNNGNNNFLLLKASGTGPVSFAIQSVDNSFHAAKSGLCIGSGSAVCTNLSVETLELCKNENIELVSTQVSLWFSLSDGLLATDSTYAFTASKPDTIFSFTPQQGDVCSSIKAFVIKTPSSLVKESLQTRYVCTGVQLEMKVESGWQAVTWSSTKRGFISNNNSILFNSVEDDTVKVVISDGAGCTIQRNTFVKISRPVVELNGEVFQILKGERVQLIADGGEEYLWEPSSGLTDATIANPFATPQQTTTYTVTVVDSVGCTAIASVLVIVEGSAFIPTLFTPNADGKNDELKVFGLTPVKNFSFTIHNREGSLVYESTDINEATSMGWNGSARGIQQPSGIYYWKVKGEFSSGRQVRLNGKSTGSVVLIR